MGNGVFGPKSGCGILVCVCARLFSKKGKKTEKNNNKKQETRNNKQETTNMVKQRNTNKNWLEKNVGETKKLKKSCLIIIPKREFVWETPLSQKSIVVQVGNCVFGPKSGCGILVRPAFSKIK